MRLIVTCFFFLLLVSCSQKKKYSPESLPAKEQDKMMMLIIRYLAKAPENVSGQERFSEKYNEYYQETASQHLLEMYFAGDNNVHYFLISRPAPSIMEKRVATGLKVTIQGDSLARYEEVFRTWKMKPEELKTKSALLFDLMVKGASLEKYETRFTAPEEYVEFPDERTFFDVSSRTWKLK